MVFSDEDNKTIISKRIQKGIWHNLYEFPLIETETTETDIAVLVLIQNQNFIKNRILEIQLCNPESIVHKLSHQHLTIKFWKVTVEGTLPNGMDCESASKFPFPIVIYNFIEKEWF